MCSRRTLTSTPRTVSTAHAFSKRYNLAVVIAITQKPTQVKPEYTDAAAAGTTEEDIKVLKEKLDALKKVPKNKTVRLLYQPAEEGPGGAKPMVE